MGEGGAVMVEAPDAEEDRRELPRLGPRLLVRDRQGNTCGTRFAWQLGELPYGYDHKYTYSHIGYNLKLSDMQAAVGVAQLDKLDGFIQARKDNWQYLHDGLADLDCFVLPGRRRDRSRAGSASR